MLSFEDLFTKPRKSARSFAELLPWFGMITDYVVLCQDGSLLAGFAVAGDDVEGKENYEVDHRINQMQTALRSLGERVTLWSIQERRYVDGYPAGAFTNPVAQAIDDQWAASLRVRRNAVIKQHFFLAYNFPSWSEAFFESLSAEVQEHDGNFFKAVSSLAKRRLSDRGAIAGVRGQLAEMAAEFEKVLAAFSGVVELNLGFRRLRGKEFLGELHARANFASIRGPVTPPEGRSYLNTLLATDSVERKHDLMEFKGVNKTVYVAALSTTGTPQEAHSLDMDKLMAVDCEYVLVQCYRFLDRMVAEKAIQDAEMFYRSEVKSVVTRVAERLFDVESEKVNTGNLHLAQDAQDALVELTTQDISYGYYNMSLLAIGETPRHAEAAADVLGGSLRSSGFTIVRERHGLMAAVLTSFPGNANATLRWKLASTANIADLAPIRTITRGEATHPLFSRVIGHEVPPLCRFLTPYGVTYDFNTHQDDLGHTAVIGGSGAGKTSLMTLFVAQFQKYHPSQTYIFDKDYSLAMASVLMGGKHVDVSSAGSSRAMNPVGVMMMNDDDMRLRQWIEVLITAGGSTVSAEEGSSIFTAIQGLRRSPSSAWRLSALYALIAGENLHLAAKLAPYVDRSDSEDDYGSGVYASYFDSLEDNFSLTKMVCLECGGILQTPQLASPFMDYAFYCIERSLDGTTPTFIYVEEAWYMLSNPVFLQKFEDWLRTFRKKRAFVVFATQALDEIARLPNVGSFTQNIPTQIFLPSVKGSSQSQAELYRTIFGTNEAQMQLLASAIPKRDYLLIKPTVTRLVNTQMPPALIAINEATTQPAKVKQMFEYRDDGLPNWEARFMKEVLNIDIGTR